MGGTPAAGPGAPASGAHTALPTGVVTFLLSDVEGSTRLWEGDERDAGAAIARHYELLDAAILLHGGVRPAEQGEGDSVVGAFARPSDAVAAALAAQRAFAEEPWPPGCALRIRIALHTGEAQLRGGEYYVGRTVIRCARLRSVAHGGQTVLSGATRDLAADRLPDGASLRDLGSHRLKDLGAPERVWQLCHPDLADGFPPLRSLDAVVNNLPAQLTSFVGRDDELDRLRTALGESRLVTLTGAGGAGKTRLAVHAVAEVAERYADGAWWVELAAVPEPELLPYAVAYGLGIRTETSGRLVDALCERVRGMDALLALDNCEHLVEPCAGLVERLLAAAPGLRVLATSREPLGLTGEVIWRVPPLGGDAAARLFVDRAGAVRPGFAPDDGEARAIDAVCRRLDGIPLAIELAAARVRMMAPDRIAAALDDRFRLLTGGGRTALPRQQTLELSVAWSHELLDEYERVLLRRLSVFAGSFVLEAVESVCAADPLDRYAVLDVLSRLVDKSLVHVEPGSASYRLLETIRLYAAQRLLEAGEGDATRDAHLAYFLALAEGAAPEAAGPSGAENQAAALDRLATNLDNLQAAFVWTLASGQTESALRLASATVSLWRMRARRAEGARWLADALAAPGEVGPAHRLRALIAWNRLESDLDEASARRVEETVRLARQVDDPALLARALAGGVAFLTHSSGWTMPCLAEALGLAQALDDDEVVLQARYWSAMIVMLDGEPAAAEPLIAEAVELARTRGNGYLVRALSAFRGMSMLLRGQALRATPLLEDVAAESLSLGERTVAMYARAFVGWGWALQGQLDAAAAACGASAELSGLSSGVHDAAALMGSVVSDLARGDGAAAAATSAHVRQAMLQAPAFRTMFEACWAEAAFAAADVESARRLADECIAGTTRPLLRWQAAWARQARARVALVDGDAHRAEDLALQALALRAGIEDLAGLADSLEFVALLKERQEAHAEGVRLLAAAASARATAGCRRFAIHAFADDLTARLRERLGEKAFAQAWEQGGALSPEEAVAYASRGRGQRRKPTAGWAALTRTEAEVARLVADGLRNKEIADRLFVSPRTVQTHLSNIFTKLGLTSRVQLAQEVTRHTTTHHTTTDPGGTR